jgi:hypothetical protein
MADGPIRTTDLVLASVLSLEGMEVMLEIGARGNMVTFVVADPEERGDLRQIASDCLAGKLQVAPFAFAKEMAEVRGRMYEFLRLHRGEAPSRRDEAVA